MNAACCLDRILRPGNPIPADIRPFLNRHPDMADRTCAVVEFEITAHAHRAVKELNELNRDYTFITDRMLCRSDHALQKHAFTYNTLAF